MTIEGRLLDQLRNSMQEKFKADLRLLYPDGLENSHQHRDLVKVWLMGFLAAVDIHDEVRPFVLAIIKPLTDFNWWPDDGWKWWCDDSTS